MSDATEDRKLELESANWPPPREIALLLLGFSLGQVREIFRLEFGGTEGADEDRRIRQVVEAVTRRLKRDAHTVLQLVPDDSDLQQNIDANVEML